MLILVTGALKVKVYIILAYPNKNGLCYAAFEKAKEGFEIVGHEIKVTDLYEERFDPVLVFDQEHKRHDMQFDEETEVYRENIKWADHLVFVFPIWWSGMPAILKGFTDRVLTTGFAYNFKGLMPIGYLKGKTAWIINTHDTPALYAALFRQDYGKILKRQILATCGVKTVEHTTLAFVRKSSPEKRENWLEKVFLIAQKS